MEAQNAAEEKDLLAWNKLAKDALVEEDFHLDASSFAFILGLMAP